MKKNKAIFFDRDGVLIEAPIVDGKPKSSKYLNQIVLCKNIKEICEKYKNSYLLIMVTNQPDFKRGINTKKNIEIINGYLKKKLKLDDVFVCYSDDERCFNRKPNPGMILDAQKKYNIDLKKSYLIGDRWRDIGAGNKAKCKTIFINKNYNEKNIFKAKYTINKIKEILKIIK